MGGCVGGCVVWHFSAWCTVWFSERICGRACVSVALYDSLCFCCVGVCVVIRVVRVWKDVCCGLSSSSTLSIVVAVVVLAAIAAIIVIVVVLVATDVP